MNPEAVLKFWFETLTMKDWFSGEERVDKMIADQFLELWEKSVAGKCDVWMKTPQGALALILVLDQFPRNMFRKSGKSFESDPIARSVANRVIEEGLDMELPEGKRMFVYLPFMHSEDLAEQDRCVELISERMPVAGTENLVHAKAHREIIRTFGRFPYRNQALGRADTPEESAWLEQVGYMKMVEKVRNEAK